MAGNSTSTKKICSLCQQSMQKETTGAKNITCSSCTNAIHINCLHFSERDKPLTCDQCLFPPPLTSKPDSQPNFDGMIKNIDTICSNGNPSLIDVVSIMKGMIISQQFIAHKFDNNIEAIRKIQSENVYLKSTVNDLNSKVNHLEEQVNKINQQKLKNHIVITGIPTNLHEKNKNLISSIGTVLKIEIKPENIIYKRLMQPKNKPMDFAPLLIEFNDHKIKQSMMANLKENGPILFDQLNILNQKNNRIIIHEYLTDFNAKLLKEVRKLKITHKIGFQWYKNGFIWARQTENSKIYKIKSLKDVEMLKTHLKTNQPSSSLEKNPN